MTEETQLLSKRSQTPTDIPFSWTVRYEASITDPPEYLGGIPHIPQLDGYDD